MLRLWALLTGQKYVALFDNDGAITFTVAKKYKFGYVAKRLWPWNIRNVILNDDGTVENGCYVVRWKEA